MSRDGHIGQTLEYDLVDVIAVALDSSSNVSSQIRRPGKEAIPERFREGCFLRLARCSSTARRVIGCWVRSSAARARSSKLSCTASGFKGGRIAALSASVF